MAKINCLSTECQEHYEGRTETCSNGTEYTPDITLIPQGGNIEMNSCEHCYQWAKNRTWQAECQSIAKPNPNVAPLGGFRRASGISEEKVGRIMAVWAYAGVFAGTLALYKYFDLLKRDKTKLLVGYGIVFAGLALGSAVGSRRVEKAREKKS